MRNSTYEDRLHDGMTVATQPNFKISNEGSSDQFPGTAGFEILLEKETSGLEDRVLSVGLLSKLRQVDDEEPEADEIAAHYHSIATNSFGVLADVQTGGLKQDLSSAFSEDDDIGDGMEFEDEDNLISDSL